MPRSSMRTSTCTATRACRNSSRACSAISRFTTSSDCTSPWTTARQRSCTAVVRPAPRSGRRRDEGVRRRVPCRCVFGGMALASEGREKKSPRGGWPRGGAPSARRRPGYPLVGCTPAEPTSVWPGMFKVSRRARGSQEQPPQPRCSGQDGSTRSSEGFPFFGLDNGVHLRGFSF